MNAVKATAARVQRECRNPGTLNRRCKRMALVAAATLSAIAFSTLANAAGRVFYDGFEDGTTNKWQQDSYRNKCTVITVAADGGAAKSGSRMLKCNWNGVVAWNDPASFETLVLDNYSYASEILFRFWIRPDANAKDHPANGAKILRVGRESFWALNFRDGLANGSFWSSAAQLGGTFWGGSNLSDGKWHKLEFYIKQGTNGAFKYWEDGVLKHSATNINTMPADGKWSPVYISSNWSGADGCCDHDTTNYLYWDEFEIYTDTGSGATGSLADASISAGGSSPPPVAAPPAPTGLGIATSQ